MKTSLPIGLLIVSLVSSCGTVASTVGVSEKAELTPQTSGYGFLGEVPTSYSVSAKADYLAAQYQALETKQPVEFGSSLSDARGKVSVSASAYAEIYPGRDCQKYTSVVWVLGQGKLVEGDACRNELGVWQPMAQSSLSD